MARGFIDGRMSTGHVRMYVYGTDMRCPMCSELVRSGQQHECFIRNGKIVRKRPSGKTPGCSSKRPKGRGYMVDIPSAVEGDY